MILSKPFACINRAREDPFEFFIHKNHLHLRKSRNLFKNHSFSSLAFETWISRITIFFCYCRQLKLCERATSGSGACNTNLVKPIKMPPMQSGVLRIKWEQNKNLGCCSFWFALAWNTHHHIYLRDVSAIECIVWIQSLAQWVNLLCWLINLYTII